jgi:hypothetical protein
LTTDLTGVQVKVILLPSFSHPPQRPERMSDQDARDDNAEVLPIGHERPGARHDRGKHEQQDGDTENGPQMLEHVGELHGAHDEPDGENVMTRSATDSMTPAQPRMRLVSIITRFPRFPIG